MICSSLTPEHFLCQQLAAACLLIEGVEERILDSNPAFTQLSGWHAHEFRDQSIGELIRPDQTPAEVSFLGSANGVWQEDLVLRPKNASRWLPIRASVTQLQTAAGQSLLRTRQEEATGHWPNLEITNRPQRLSDEILRTTTTMAQLLTRAKSGQVEALSQLSVLLENLMILGRDLAPATLPSSVATTSSSHASRNQPEVWKWQTATTASLRQSEEQTQSKGKVLVVDDEESVLDVASRLVEKAGYTAVKARDGDEAIAILRERTGEITMALVDASLPRISGEQTMRELRHLSPRLPLILMSGYSETDVVSDARSVGIVGFLQKPFRLPAIIDILQRAERQL
jgi:CheY-like chemotaxis protein